MASYNWFLIHHGDGRREGGVCSGRRDNKVHGSPCVTPRPYLTKSTSSVMTWSSHLYLTRSGNELISFRSSGWMHDMTGAM